MAKIMDFISVKGIKKNLNTSEVTDMSDMFSVCESLKNIDVSGFNTDKVTDMGAMFSGCFNLQSLDISRFNTENVVNMISMFSGSENLKSLDVSGFKTNKVKGMTLMFANCTNLTTLDVSIFNTSNVINMECMFDGCINLKTIYVGDDWNTSSLKPIKMFGMDDLGYKMFEHCPNLIGGQGTKYDQYHIDAEYARIDGGESNPGYFTKKTK